MMRSCCLHCPRSNARPGDAYVRCHLSCMFTLKPTDNEDPKFTEIVSTILNSIVQLYHPDQVYVVEIDHWFDHKWKAFSGTVLGALGVWQTRLTLPPFNPNTVLRQLYYEKDTPGSICYALMPAASLHIKQSSDANMQRFVDRLSENAVIVWYSGATNASDAASVMLYIVKDEATEAWYVVQEEGELEAQ